MKTALGLFLILLSVKLQTQAELDAAVKPQDPTITVKKTLTLVSSYCPDSPSTESNTKCVIIGGTTKEMLKQYFKVTLEEKHASETTKSNDITNKENEIKEIITLLECKNSKKELKLLYIELVCYIHGISEFIIESISNLVAPDSLKCEITDLVLKKLAELFLKYQFEEDMKANVQEIITKVKVYKNTLTCSSTNGGTSGGSGLPI